MNKAKIALQVLNFMDMTNSHKERVAFCHRTFAGEELTHALNCITVTNEFCSEARKEYKEIREAAKSGKYRRNLS